MLGLVAACTSFSSTETETEAQAPPVEPPEAGVAGGAGDAGPDLAEAYRQAVLAAGPIAYFRFDDPPGRRTFVDEVAQRSATAKDDFTLTEGPLHGRAVRFDGNGQLDLGMGFGFVGNASFTIEMWISVGAIDDGFRRLLSTETDIQLATWSGYAASVNEGSGLSFVRWVNNVSCRVTVAAERVALDSVHHVVLWYNGEKSTIWFDGVEEEPEECLAGLPDERAPLVLAGTSGSNLIGALDEFAIYDRALTADVIQAHTTLGRQLAR